jgi:hypothetical protein
VAVGGNHLYNQEVRARWPLLVLLGLLVVLIAAAPAEAIRIGADLNRPANVSYGCEAFPTTNAFGNRFFLGSGFGTCTYLGAGRLSDQSESPGARGAPGVLTRVLVKAGPAVGPMQAVILRATRSGSGFACCFAAGQSQVFTPQPNAVTAVGVRLPMRSDFDAAFGETVDYVGITVLAPGVPVPGHDEGVPGDVTRGSALAFFPHVGPGDTRVDGAGVGAFTPLIAGDFFPLCGASAIRGLTSAQAGTPCIPGVQLVDNVARLDGTGLFVKVICNVAAPCNGDIRFQSRRVRVAAAAKPVTYGRVRFNVASGSRRRVKGKLTAAGRRLLKGHRRAKAYAVARVGGRVIASRRVTIRK